jgi:methylmalonyl-CoA decarboxylase
MALIQTRESESIATIAFDNYSKRNALSGAPIGETIAAFEQFSAKGVRAVVLRSGGGSSGGNGQGQGDQRNG